MTTLTTARELIEDFSDDPEDYPQAVDPAAPPSGLTLDGPAENNQVYLRGRLSGHVTIRFGDVSGCRVFLGDNLQGSLTIALRGDKATVFVGRDCDFNELTLRSRQAHDVIAIGNGVAVTGPGTWISGLRAGYARPGIVMGDCCVVARDVLLRNTDGHPVFDRTTRRQINAPASDIVIEPHVWLGERAAVLKDVRIGAFAVVALGSVVTRDVPRYALASGVPATCSVRGAQFWAWDDSSEGLARAEHFLERFPPE
jgi:acetyltransferase-like isoleucine patch superfamily enzyme